MSKENQTPPSELRRIATKEVALLSGFLFVGLVIVPVLIYQVGQGVFGDYGGAGFGEFFGRLSGKIRHGDLSAWFLVLAPYMGWQCLRLIGLGWRAAGSVVSDTNDN